jgi:hypothetical protein
MNYIENLKKSFDEKELLKITNLTLTGIVIALCGTLVATATRDPILVDRSAHKTVIIEKVTTDEGKLSEVENFLREALSLRFDSKAKSSNELLSKELARAHEIEEGELKAKQVTQSVVVNGVQKSKDGFIVDVDRVVSISKLRSAFSFPLKVQILKVDRSEQNPYGLVLIRVEKLKELPREN